MLCFDGEETTELFQPLGVLKHVQLFSRFSFLINQTNHIEVCGRLESEPSIIHSSTKTFLEIPGDKLIDVSVNSFGANILVETNKVKKVYYIGYSNPFDGNYYDIGVS